MWYETESSVKPYEVDTVSSKVYNYARRDIKEVERDGVTVYTYEEIKIPKEQWYLYQQNESIKAENEMLNDTLLGVFEILDTI